MKNKKKDPGHASAETAHEISGHVVGYHLGHELMFQIKPKKGKDQLCRLATSHGLFDAMADAIAQAHWADRKIHIVGAPGENGVFSVETMQIGDVSMVKRSADEKDQLSAAG